MRPLPSALKDRSARRAPAGAVDPAKDAAALLRRLGFAILTILVPTAALVTRRAVVVLAPIGIALLVIAALLDGERRPLAQTATALATSIGGLAGLILFFWCALSLAWTPFIGPGSERLLNIAATIGAAVAAYLALPDRMRSANLYLLPVGVGVAAVFAMGLALFAPASRLDDDGQNLERGLVVLSLFLWPAVAWLRSRQRDLEALLLAVGVAFATILAPHPLPAAALAVGGLAYALTTIRPPLGVRVAALTMAGLLALAPLIPLILRPTLGAWLGGNSPITIGLGIWRRIVLNEPLRLITGHGFETALRGRVVGLLPVNAPSSLLFEVWYELGIVGALAGAMAIYQGVTAAGRDHPPLVPGVIAAFAAAFTLACLGIGTAQMWWFTALSLLVIVFVAAERGQFRTRRPKAMVLNRPANDR